MSNGAPKQLIAVQTARIQSQTKLPNINLFPSSFPAKFVCAGAQTQVPPSVVMVVQATSLMTAILWGGLLPFVNPGCFISSWGRWGSQACNVCFCCFFVILILLFICCRSKICLVTRKGGRELLLLAWWWKACLVSKACRRPELIARRLMIWWLALVF